MQPDASYSLDLFKDQVGQNAVNANRNVNAYRNKSRGLAASGTSVLPGVKAGSVEEKDQKRWKAALDFESMFLGQMYKGMRQSAQSTGGDELTDPSPGREIFTDMLDQEYANLHSKSPIEGGVQGQKNAASGMSNSLAAQIYRAMTSNEKNNVTPAAAKNATTAHPGQGPVLADAVLDPIVEHASRTYGVDSNLIRSVIKNESANKPQAVSKAGAKGLMQIMDSTAKDLGLNNVFNPVENVMAGTRYLKQLLERFRGDEKLALAGYNAGPANVEHYKGVPPFAETHSYVEKVLKTKSNLDARVAETGSGRK